MNALVQIVGHTPPYVFLALAYGLFASLRAFRPRSAALFAMPIMPAVFLVLSVGSLISAASVLPTAVLAWVAALGAGAAMGASVLAAEVMAVDRSRGRVTVGGSAMVLVLFVVIFSLKYFNGVMRATSPVLSGTPGFILAITAISGLGAGIMVGRIAKLFSAYFRTGAAAKAEA